MREESAGLRVQPPRGSSLLRAGARGVQWFREEGRCAYWVGEEPGALILEADRVAQPHVAACANVLHGRLGMEGHPDVVLGVGGDGGEGDGDAPDGGRDVADAEGRDLLEHMHATLSRVVLVDEAEML